MYYLLKEAVRNQITWAPEGKPFIGTSGRELQFYIDLRPLLLDGHFLAAVQTWVWRYCYDYDLSSVAGPELGGAILAVNVISSISTYQGAIIRKNKDLRHKSSVIFSKNFDKAKPTLVLDDIATSGGSLLSSINALRSEGITVTSAMVVVDREEGASEFLKMNGVTLNAIYKVSELK